MIAKKVSGIAAMALMAVILASMLAANASATDVSGLVRTSGPGYDLYMPAEQNVTSEQLILFVNYDIHEMTLTLRSGNVTHLTQVISPQSSQFLTLKFPLMASYSLKVVDSYGNVIGQYLKVHSAAMLPPADPNTWHINPPTIPTTDGTIYTQKQLDDITTWIETQFFIYGAPILLVGSALGWADKRITMIRKMTDVFSWLFFGVLALDTYTHFITVNSYGLVPEYDRLWYVLLVLGYVIGRYLTYIETDTTIRINSGKSQLNIRKEVVYTPPEHTGQCIQIQSNSAMLKRIFLGIHTPLGTDGSLSPDWDVMIDKKGLFSRTYHDRGFWIQREKTIIKEGPSYLFGLFRTQIIEKQYELANASSWPKPMFVQMMSAFLDLGEENKKLNNALVKEKMMHSNEASSHARAMLTRAFTLTRSNASKDYVNSEIAAPDISDSGEERMDNFEDAATKPIVEARPEPTDEDLTGSPESDSGEQTEETPAEKESRPRKAKERARTTKKTKKKGSRA